MPRLFPLLFAIACGGTETPTTNCDDYNIAVPSVRGELSASWDAARDRMVFFGGNDSVPVNCEFGATNFRNDTWAYSRTCNAFQELAPTESPAPRGRHQSTTDGTHLYIGNGRFRQGTTGDYTLRRDVWSFDYATEEWARLAFATGPAARSNAAWVHLDGALWLFGGNTSTFGGAFLPQDDLWRFDLTSQSWTEVERSGGAWPQRRLFHAMATDGELIYVYAGGDENAFLGPFLADLWAYDPQTGQWTEMLHDGNNGPAVPSDRFWANLEYDPIDNSLVVFGGHDNTSLGNTNQVYRYSLDEGRWFREQTGDTVDNDNVGFCDFPDDFVAIDMEAPERRNAGASVMTSDGEMLVFGGKTDCGLVNDVWSYSVAAESWSELSPSTSGEVCRRSGQSCSALCN